MLSEGNELPGSTRAVMSGLRPMWSEAVTYLSGGCEDSGLRVAGWDWCPLVLLVASLYWEPPGWKLDFLSAQILEKVPCF